MPFNSTQFVFIENDMITISTNYARHIHGKSVSNNVITICDFFKAFSKLKIENVLGKAVFESFPTPDFTTFDNYGHRFYRNDYEYSYSDNVYGAVSDDFEWNPYLETYTLGGV